MQILLFTVGAVATCLLLALLHGQNTTIKLIKNMATTLDQLLQEVQDSSTVEDSIISLLTNIKTQLDAALSAELTPAAQAKVDAIFAALEANQAKLSDAMLANTPAAP